MEKIETWHVGFSCQYTHFMSFSSKSEHVTVPDQATLRGFIPNPAVYMALVGVLPVEGFRFLTFQCWQVCMHSLIHIDFCLKQG